MEKEMENLKSVDLMLGDYVICHRPTKPQEIVNVTAELLSVIERQEKGIINNIKSPMYRVVKPIPLTEEILKKNGFSKIGTIGNTYIHCFYEHIRYYEIEINLHDNMLWINKMWFKANNIQYVHELQNALRLCKVEKEIEL